MFWTFQPRILKIVPSLQLMHIYGSVIVLQWGYLYSSIVTDLYQKHWTDLFFLNNLIIKFLFRNNFLILTKKKIVIDPEMWDSVSFQAMCRLIGVWFHTTPTPLTRLYPSNTTAMRSWFRKSVTERVMSERTVRWRCWGGTVKEEEVCQCPWGICATGAGESDAWSVLSYSESVLSVANLILSWSGISAVAPNKSHKNTQRVMYLQMSLPSKLANSKHKHTQKLHSEHLLLIF